MIGGVEGVTKQFAGQRVLVTGHTGFKGAWLSAWLDRLGARVSGVSLPPDDAQRPLFDAVQRLVSFEHSEMADLVDDGVAHQLIADLRPDVVLHLAAQPLVRLSYDEPVRTMAVNVMGTANVLDACRGAHRPRAVVCVTSDKCYENTGQLWPYRESDPVGGFDPYSASKGAAEIVVASFRRSFFGPEAGVLVASARAGNVIGPGDLSQDRLVPDFFRAVESQTTLRIRYPDATRPWQHVLESLSGYLVLAAALLAGETSAATGWNFGPEPRDIVPVGQFVELLASVCGDQAPPVEIIVGDGPHEAAVLALDASQARYRLGWRPLLTLQQRAEMTATGYLESQNQGDLAAVVQQQIDEFMQRWKASD